MKFSVVLPSSYEGLGYRLGFVRDPSVFARLAVVAESCGFDAVWANDHLTTPRFLRGAPEGPPSFFEPLITLAHVAARTRRLRLGTAVLALPLRDPLSLAKQVATLDVLSAGRLTLGIGLGAYREELANAYPERARKGQGAVFTEVVEALRQLLDEGGGSYRGASFHFEDAELAPRVRQRPFPIYVGGHTTAAIERAARWGQGWMPGWRPLAELRDRVAMLHERLVAARRDAGAVEVAPELSATIERRHEDAVRRYETSRFVHHRKLHDRTGRDPALMTASNLVGSPEAILERVAAMADAGIDHCAAIAFPAETVDELVEQWQLFAVAVGLRPSSRPTGHRSHLRVLLSRQHIVLTRRPGSDAR